RWLAPGRPGARQARQRQVLRAHRPDPLPGALMRRRGFARDVAVAFPPWLIAHAITFGALAVARYAVHHGDVHKAGAAFRAHQGLFAWDAAYYRDIAEHGYRGVEYLGV